MTSLIIIAAFAVSVLVLLLLCAILGSILEVEKLLSRIFEENKAGENAYASSKTRFSRPASPVSDDEEKKILEQRRWDEGIANLLSYMGQLKGGDKL